MDLEDLGGIVRSKTRTYRVEVTYRQPKPGFVYPDSMYDIYVLEDETDENVFTQTFRLRHGDSFIALRDFVDGIKEAAARDFRG
jgi:hypothetical protein